MTRFWNACRFHIRLINEPWEQLSQIFLSVTSTLYLLVELRSDLRLDRPNYDKIQICHGGRDFYFWVSVYCCESFPAFFEKADVLYWKTKKRKQKIFDYYSVSHLSPASNAWHHILICRQNANERVWTYKISSSMISNLLYIVFETFSTHFFCFNLIFCFKSE